MSVEAGIKRYRLVERIAQGAFGALWRAADCVPGKEVAIRIVSSPIAPQEAIAAFEAEMTRATALHHRALAQVYEVGRDSDGGAWAASEFVVGDSLESVLSDHGPLSPTTALGLFAELARAVAELHSHGVVHGSISARAVLVQRSKSGPLWMRPKLIGLGRARLLPRQGKTATPPEGAYSSPEVVASRQYGAASDIWALGILLFHCVTGRPGFAARTTTSFVAETRVLHRTLDMIEDEVVRGLVEQCLALAPDDRPSTAALIKQAELAGWIEQSDMNAAPPDTSPSVRPVVAPAIAAAPFDEPRPIAQAEPAARPESIGNPPMAGPVSAIDRRAGSTPALSPFESIADVPETLVDFRPRRRGAKVVAVVVASSALLALLAATSEPRHRSSAARVVIDEAATAVTAPVPPAAATVTTTATVTAAPIASASAPPQTPSVVNSAVKPPPAVAANAKPAPQMPVHDDNPYE